MPRPVEPQSDQFSLSPSFKDLHSQPRPSDPGQVPPGSPQDHAYHLSPQEHEYSGPYNEYYHQHEPSEHDEHRMNLADEDQESGYNWGPPPEGHHGF
jgi:hypothetical protein